MIPYEKKRFKYVFYELMDCLIVLLMRKILILNKILNEQDRKGKLSNIGQVSMDTAISLLFVLTSTLGTLTVFASLLTLALFTSSLVMAVLVDWSSSALSSIELILFELGNNTLYGGGGGSSSS